MMRSMPIKRVRGLARRSFMGAAVASSALLSSCGIFKDKPKPILPGRRYNVLSTGAGLMVDPSDHTPIHLPPVTPVTQWPQAGRVPSHLGVNGAWGGTKFRWSRRIGRGISDPALLHFLALGSNGRGAIQSPPVIEGGRIFTRDAIGTVRAWTWPNMHLLWTFVPKPKGSLSSDLGGGLGVHQGVLYIVDGVGQAVAVDAASGHVKWRADTVTPGRSAPTIVNGRVFFGTIDERLFALDAKTGEQLWTYQATQASTVLFGQSAPAVVDNVVVAGFGSGDLVALRAQSGELVWSDSLGGSNGRGAMLDLACVRGAPIICQGTAYAVSLSNVLVAIDMRSGRRLWEREVSSQNTPVIVDSCLYLISTDQQIACIDRISGQVRWINDLRRYKKEQAEKDAITWFGPILAEGKLVCVPSSAMAGLQVFDARNGHAVASAPLLHDTLVAPILCDNRILILASDGTLNAYG